LSIGHVDTLNRHVGTIKHEAALGKEIVLCEQEKDAFCMKQTLGTYNSKCEFFLDTNGILYKRKCLQKVLLTATTSDINLLHDVLNELQFQNSEISHSLVNQFTYVKKLNTAVKINTEAIANLSNIIKDTMIQLHERFHQVARDILWLNITLLGQSELHSVIRQLEFTLFQLVQQIDDLFNIIQCAIHG